MDFKQFLKKLNIKLYSQDNPKAEFDYNDEYGLTAKDWSKAVKEFLKQPFLWSNFTLYNLYEINLYCGIHNHFPTSHQELIDTWIDNFDIDNIQSSLEDFMTEISIKDNFNDFVIVNSENDVSSFYLIENWERFSEDELENIVILMDFKDVTALDKKDKIVQILENFVILPKIDEKILKAFEMNDFSIEKDTIYDLIYEITGKRYIPPTLGPSEEEINISIKNILQNLKLPTTEYNIETARDYFMANSQNIENTERSMEFNRILFEKEEEGITLKDTKKFERLSFISPDYEIAFMRQRNK